MGVNAAQHFMNQATFHSTFPLLVKLKYLIIYKKLNNYQINYWVNFHCTYLKLQNCNEFENLLLDPDRHSSQLSVKRISQFRSQVTFQRTLLFFLLNDILKCRRPRQFTYIFKQTKQFSATYVETLNYWFIQNRI